MDTFNMDTFNMDTHNMDMRALGRMMSSHRSLLETRWGRSLKQTHFLLWLLI